MPARTFALVWIQSGFDVKMPKLLKLLSKQIYQSRASLKFFCFKCKNTLCPSTTFISALPIFSPSNNYYYIFQLVEQRAQDKVSHFPNSFYYVSTPLLFVWIFLCLAVIIRGKCVPLTGIKSIGDHDDGFPCVVLFFADLNPWLAWHRG